MLPQRRGQKSSQEWTLVKKEHQPSKQTRTSTVLKKTRKEIRREKQGDKHECEKATKTTIGPSTIATAEGEKGCRSWLPLPE